MRLRPLVLIVEDEPDLLVLMRVILESNGWDTVLAADGVTALERFDAVRPDLVLLDLMLPVMDGWTVLEEMRTRPSPPPVIVCSAARSSRDPGLAAERGAAAIISKPLDVDTLLRAVDRVVGETAAARITLPQLVDGTEPPLSGIQPA